jgi:hypothetical protein
MSERTIVGGRRQTQRGHVWPAAGPWKPCASPTASGLPHLPAVPMPAGHDSCHGDLTLAQRRGGTGIQSP